ncbi:DUF1642 domain-containing protein [Lactococcus petauri]|uniref:DUF1642 domain-containing protein n=1 Tax=Lactococcus petauri TaxID=1940789 RepID=UPI002550ECA8|nr:DUF1642 domain-containing protein [Lactococcus petauri]
MNKVEAQIVNRPSIDPVTVADNANQALYKNCREWREYATALEEDVRNLSERLVELDSKSEEQQPEIPEFMVEWIESKKGENYRNGKLLISHYQWVFHHSNRNNKVNKWIQNNFDVFLQALVNGYTVSKEKRFYIKVKNTCPTKYVWLNQSTKNIYFDNRSTNWTNNGNVKNIFTKSELTEIANGTLYKQEYEREELTDREWFNPLFELIPVDDEK